ncbi:cystatin C (amyloid angiopathy and cerebral hemorrhage) [Scomber scombrus]|uniref:Cystatin C (Amyloid angiopathy and cerebral hemorrhage) n=1 Tax=Scomber scombrus TaxID=13677 RepID=A0AAV1MYG6_SCOSC
MMWKLVFPALAAVFTLGLAGMVGGPRDIDVNDSGLKNALNFAVVQHNRGTNDLFVSQVAEVLKAQSQFYQCTFTVWSRPWLSDIRVLEEKCQ